MQNQQDFDLESLIQVFGWPVFDAVEVQVKVFVLNKFLQLQPKRLPAHVTSKDLEAAELDGALTFSVEICGAIILLVENVQLGKAINNFYRVIEVIVGVRHPEDRFEYVWPSWDVQV